METTSAIHWQIPKSISSAAVATTNHHRRRRHNVQNPAQFTMLLRDLTLRRITTTTTPYQQFRSNRQNLNNISISPKSMADESKKTDIQPEKDESATTTTTATLSVSESKEEKETEKSTPSIPPPPEKPLPGDCCGSGCVSCVWDLYYEELEEYNRLYKANST